MRLSLRFRRKEPALAVGGRQKKSLLLVALALAVAAGAAVYAALNGIYQPANVVVAARNLEPLQKIEAKDVKVVQVAKRDKHPSAFSDPRQVVGAFTKMPLVAGEPVLVEKIVRNPDKMLEVYGTAGPEDTVIVLKSNQASWPETLKDGDYVSIVAAYPDRVEDLARGARVVHNPGSWSPVGEIKALKKAEAGSSGGEILLMLNREDAKKVLQAAVSAKGLHVLPETSAELERMGKKNAGK